MLTMIMFMFTRRRHCVDDGDVYKKTTLCRRWRCLQEGDTVSTMAMFTKRRHCVDDGDVDKTR